MDFVSQQPPEILGAMVAALVLLVALLLVLSRRAKRQRMVQQSLEEFAKRRTKSTAEPAPSAAPIHSPAASASVASQASAAVTASPAPVAQDTPPTPAPAAMSESRWMQSRIPVADTRELSDSEMQAWAPTEVMPKPKDDR